MSVFEYYSHGEVVRAKYAKGKPSLTGKEFHNYGEIVYFVSGNARFVSKNIQQNLSPGTLVLIPKEHFHQFIVDKPESYVRCILGFDETDRLRPLIAEAMDEVKVIENPSPEMTAVIKTLMTAMQGSLPAGDVALLAETTLIQLFLFQKMFGQASTAQNVGLSPLVAEALSYVDDHFAEDLSVRSIAVSLHTSPSTLSHSFRRELNMSIYRYISEKRISAIRQMATAHDVLADVAVQCGFKDYSAFYRMCIKYYGKRPTELIKSK